MYSLDPELCVTPVLEPKLFVYVLVQTGVIDKIFCLFEISSGGEWGITVFWSSDVIPDSTLNWTVEVCGWDDAHRALRVRVVDDKCLSRLESNSPISSCRNVFENRINIIWGSEQWGFMVFSKGEGGFHVDILGVQISKYK